MCLFVAQVGSFLPGTSSVKGFLVSALDFSPRDPGNPSAVTIRVRPNIVLFQNNLIILHLYGFKCDSTYLTLVGQGR